MAKPVKKFAAPASRATKPAEPDVNHKMDLASAVAIEHASAQAGFPPPQSVQHLLTEADPAELAQLRAAAAAAPIEADQGDTDSETTAETPALTGDAGAKE